MMRSLLRVNWDVRHGMNAGGLFQHREFTDVEHLSRLIGGMMRMRQSEGLTPVDNPPIYRPRPETSLVGDLFRKKLEKDSFPVLKNSINDNYFLDISSKIDV